MSRLGSKISRYERDGLDGLRDHTRLDKPRVADRKETARIMQTVVGQNMTTKEAQRLLAEDMEHTFHVARVRKFAYENGIYLKKGSKVNKRRVTRYRACSWRCGMMSPQRLI